MLGYHNAEADAAVRAAASGGTRAFVDVGVPRKLPLAGLETAELDLAEEWVVDPGEKLWESAEQVARLAVNARRASRLSGGKGRGERGQGLD
eukprot:7463473-Lingulodinium_polyedra.AAC.1